MQAMVMAEVKTLSIRGERPCEFIGEWVGVLSRNL